MFFGVLEVSAEVLSLQNAKLHDWVKDFVEKSVNHRNIQHLSP